MHSSARKKQSDKWIDKVQGKPPAPVLNVMVTKPSINAKSTTTSSLVGRSPRDNRPQPDAAMHKAQSSVALEHPEVKIQSQQDRALAVMEAIKQVSEMQQSQLATEEKEESTPQKGLSSGVVLNFKGSKRRVIDDNGAEQDATPQGRPPQGSSQKDQGEGYTGLTRLKSQHSNPSVDALSPVRQYIQTGGAKDGTSAGSVLLEPSPPRHGHDAKSSFRGATTRGQQQQQRPAEGGGVAPGYDPVVTLRECIKHFIANPKKFGSVNQLLLEEYNYIVSMWCAIKEQDDVDETDVIQMRLRGDDAAANLGAGGYRRGRHGYHATAASNASQQMFVKDNYFDRMAVERAIKLEQAKIQHQEHLQAVQDASMSMEERGAERRKRAVPPAAAAATAELELLSDTSCEQEGDQSFSLTVKEGDKEDPQKTPPLDELATQVSDRQKRIAKRNAKRKEKEEAAKKAKELELGAVEEDLLIHLSTKPPPAGSREEDFPLLREMALLRKKLKHQETVSDHLRSQVEVLQMELMTKHGEMAALQEQLKQSDTKEFYHRREVQELEAQVAKFKKELAEAINNRIKDSGQGPTNGGLGANQGLDKKLREAKDEIKQLYKHIKTAEHQNMALEREIDNAHLDRDEFSNRLTNTTEELEAANRDLRERDRKIAHYERKLELKRGRITHLTGAIEELEVYAGSTTMVDKMIEDHPAWGLYFYIRQHQRHFVSTAFGNPHHVFGLSNYRSQLVMTLHKMFSDQQEEVELLKGKNDEVQPVMTRTAALNKLPVSTVSDLMIPFPSPCLPNQEEQQELQEIGRKLKDTHNAGSRKKLEAREAAIRKAVAARPYDLKVVSVKNIRLNRVDVRIILLGFWKARTEAYVAERRAIAEWEALWGEKHRQEREDELARQLVGGEPLAASLAENDNDHHSTEAASDSNSPQRSPRGVAKKTHKKGLKKKAPDEETQEVNNQPAAPKIPPRPKTTTFISFLASYLNKMFPPTKRSRSVFAASSTSFLEALSPEGGGDVNIDIPSPAAATGPAPPSISVDDKHVLWESADHIVYKDYPTIPFPKFAAGSGTIPVNMPTADGGLRDPNPAVMYLSPAGLEVLYAMVFNCAEYAGTDPDCRLFHLVSNQIVPEALAINFMLTIKAIYDGCVEEVVDSVGEKAKQHREERGDHEEGSSPKNRRSTMVLAQSGPFVQNTSPTIDIGRRKSSVTPGAKPKRRRRPSVARRLEERERRKVEIAEGKEVIEYDSDGEVRIDDFAVPSDEDEATKLAAGMHLDATSPHVQKLVKEKVEKDRIQRDKVTQKRKSYIIATANATVMKSAFMTQKVSSSGMITLSTFLQLIIEHFASEWDVVAEVIREEDLDARRDEEEKSENEALAVFSFASESEAPPLAAEETQSMKPEASETPSAVRPSTGDDHHESATEKSGAKPKSKRKKAADPILRSKIIKVRRLNNIDSLLVSKLKFAVSMDQPSSVIKYQELFSCDSSGRSSFLLTELLDATIANYVSFQQDLLLNARRSVARESSLATFAHSATSPNPPPLRPFTSIDDGSLTVNILEFRKRWLDMDPNAAATIDQTLEQLLYTCGDDDGLALGHVVPKKVPTAAELFCDQFEQWRDIHIFHMPPLPALLPPLPLESGPLTTPRFDSEATTRRQSVNTASTAARTATGAHTAERNRIFPGFFPLDVLLARLHKLMLFRDSSPTHIPTGLDNDAMEELHKQPPAAQDAPSEHVPVSSAVSLSTSDVEQQVPPKPVVVPLPSHGATLQHQSAADALAAAITAAQLANEFYKDGVWSAPVSSPTGENATESERVGGKAMQMAMKHHDSILSFHEGCQHLAHQCESQNNQAVSLQNPLSKITASAATVEKLMGSQKPGATVSMRSASMDGSYRMKATVSNLAGSISLRGAAATTGEKQLPTELSEEERQENAFRITPLELAAHSHGKRKINPRIAKCVPADNFERCVNATAIEVMHRAAKHHLDPGVAFSDLSSSTNRASSVGMFGLGVGTFTNDGLARRGSVTNSTSANSNSGRNVKFRQVGGFELGSLESTVEGDTSQRPGELEVAPSRVRAISILGGMSAAPHTMRL